MLSIINAHPRDSNISFEEENHIYTIMGMEGHPISVTTLIHRFFEKFNADKIIANMMKKKNWPESVYYGMTAEEIKKQWNDNGSKQSGLGTDMHKAIEDYINDEASPQEPVAEIKISLPSPEMQCQAESVDCKIPTIEEQTRYVIPRLPSVATQTKEFGFFLKFWSQLNVIYPGVKAYRTEWLVYDMEKRLSGSIDLSLINNEGKIIICDWKRSKEIKMKGFKNTRTGETKRGFGIFSHLDDCNYQHYSLQLNIYRHILETHYGKEVVGLYLVIFHPNNDDHILIEVRRMDKEIQDLWNILPITSDH